MAEIPHVKTSLTSTSAALEAGASEGNVFNFLWSTMQNGDDGQRMAATSRADRSVQITGTFGVGGSISIEGSNKLNPGVDADWFTLTDGSSNDLIFIAPGGKAILQLTLWVRPHVTAGDGTTDIDVDVIVGGR